MTLTQEQKNAVVGNLHELIAQIVEMSANFKNVTKIYEALYKLKFRFEHESQLQQILPTPFDRKAVKEQVYLLLNK